MSEGKQAFHSEETLITLYHKDMTAARHFYEEKLGLELREATYEWYVGYWVNAAKSVTLCISSSPKELEMWGSKGRGVVIDFMVKDIDETYDLFIQRGVVFEHSPKDFPWGLRHAKFKDPAGYTLTLSAYTSIK